VTCLLVYVLRYVFCCSYTHNVAPKGKFIAFVSAEAETDNPQSELRPGIDLLGPVDELFFDMYDRYEPVNEPSLDNCFVSSVSYVLYENNCSSLIL
jgi:Rab GDP dissociation inhibitor